MKTKRLHGLFRPYADQQHVVIPWMPARYSPSGHIHVRDFTAVLFEGEWVYFLGDNPKEVKWKDLSDEQKMMARLYSKRDTGQPICDKYTDERYYIIEALKEM